MSASYEKLEQELAALRKQLDAAQQGTIFIVWDRLLEKAVSAHKTENGGMKRCEELNQARVDEGECGSWCMDFECDEFTLED